LETGYSNAVACDAGCPVLLEDPEERPPVNYCDEMVAVYNNTVNRQADIEAQIKLLTL